MRPIGRARPRVLALIVLSAALTLAVAGGRAASAAETIRVPVDYPTIQAAVDAAQSGDVVLVSPGTYPEQVNIAGKSITLASEYFTTGNQSAIDTTVIEPPVGPNAITIQKSATPNVTIVGFTIRNVGGQSIDGIKSFARAEILNNHFVGLVDSLDLDPSQTGPATAFVVRGNVIENSVDDAVDLDGPITAVVEDNILRGSREDGIEIRFHEFAGRLDIVIRGNTITGSRQDGIQLIDEVGTSDRHLTIERNIISAGRAGLGLMDNGASSEDYRAASLLDEIHLFNNTFVGNNHAVSGGDNLVAVNNLFVNSTTLGLKGVDGNSIASHNLFWGNGTNATGSNVDAATTIAADPRLAADYTLLEGSPAIDAGTTSFIWQGKTVLNLPAGSYSGAGPDLGARERTTSASGPETTITDGPPSASNATTTSFSFSASAAGSTFECALDGAAYASCTSPATYGGLGDGSHTFQVRATDPAGNTDPTPASFTWTVDTIPPQTTISSGPPDPDSASASFAFTSSEPNSTFECSLDGAPYAACSSPKAYGGLANGPHAFDVRATDAVGNVDPSPASSTWTVAASVHVVSAAGDIASCDSGAPSAGAQATAALLDGISPDAVLPLGDNAYQSGTLSEYLCAYDPTWGRHLERTRPVAGNHEYETANAAGYFQYFGARAGDPARGYYSFDLGSWHFVALNSECASVGGCGPGSPQETWLRQDLAASSTQCIAGYWHKPLFTSGRYRPGFGEVRPLFQALYDHGADLVLVSHDHNYERFARQSPSGTLDLARGVRQFVVGTGGASLYEQGAAMPNSESRNASTNGVLKLVLRSGGYNWEFVPRAGQTFTDSGSDTCDATPPDTAAPASPANLVGTADAGVVNLSWSLAGDNVGVIAHDIYRNGSLHATTTAATSYSDTSVVPGVNYTYQVRARDAAGNPSGPSNTASVVASSQVIVTLLPEADARVEQAQPATNYGTATSFGADLSPHRESYLRFTVSGLTRTVTSAKLRLFDFNGTADGPALYSTDASWSETAITWNTKPARIGGVIEDKGASATSTWVEYDVGSVVQGNGTYSFGLIPTSSDGADYNSREAAQRRPELVLTLGAETAPETTIVTGPSGSVGSAAAAFTFSSDQPGSSFECALDGAAFASCSSPQGYSGLAEGAHTFRVRAIDGVGNTDPTPASRTWTVDTTPPDTSIDSGPSGVVPTGSASFTFSSDEAGSSFECALDGAAFASCSSPRSYAGLAEGSHTFQVRATDTAGNTDETPATRTWTVDAAAPETTIGSGPNGTVSSASAAFTFSSDAPGSGFECALDGAAFASCSSPQGYSGLAEGSHTFRVRAIDGVGNADPTPASRTWTVDTTPPVTSIDSGPSGVVPTGSASFTFSSDEAGSGFECALDGAAFASCSSPQGYAGLAEGAHTFRVRAIDGVGNTDPTPATRTWTVDLPSTVVTFAAEADARVEQRKPSSNFGRSSSLDSDLSPQMESYLRFTVTGVTGTVKSAKLRLWVTNAADNGPALYAAANSWTEGGITWNTKPARTGSILDNRGSVGSDTWVEYNVLAVAAANGTYTFNLVPESSDGLTVRSREASSNRPQLVLEVD